MELPEVSFGGRSFLATPTSTTGDLRNANLGLNTAVRDAKGKISFCLRGKKSMKKLVVYAKREMSN